MRAQTVVLPRSVSVMKVSTDSISVKELNQIQKLLYVNWVWKSSQHFVMPPKVSC